MQNPGLLRLRCRGAVCFFLVALAAGLASCNDLGGPIQWATYTIVYHSNDGNYKTVSTVHRHGDTHDLRRGVFDRVGFTFKGWARERNAPMEFVDGENISRLAARVDDVIDLFAVWAPYTFTVIYNANGGTGGDNGVLENVYTFAIGERLSPNPFTPPGLLYFGGWAKSPGGPPEFEDEDLFFNPELQGNLPLENGGIIRLYARWIASNSFTIIFKFNGGTDADGKSYEEKENEPAGRLLWLPNEYGLEFPPLSRPGYIFDGWNTCANGSGNSYRSGDRFIPVDNITLFAQWRPIGATFIVTFNANNAEGTPPSPVHVSVGNPYAELPGMGSLSRPGYNFIGWSSRADGLGAVFPAGYMFRPTNDIMLYARWVSFNEPPPLDIPWAAVAVGVPYTTHISFAFADQVTGLVASDIIVTYGTGEITTGALTMAPDGRLGSLAVTAITSPGSVYVSINRQGIAVGPQEVLIFNHEIIIPWAAVAVGVPTTTAINFTFGATVLGLTENDIMVVDGDGAVTTGVLTMAADGRSGSLAVTAITNPGYVTVSVNSPGVAGGSQTVMVFDYEITPPDIPWAAVAVGVPYTTHISFAFADQVTGLATNDITVTSGTGVITTGALTMAADGRSGSLAVTAITSPGSVQVSINRQGIAVGPQAVVILEIIEPDTPWAAVAIGVPATTAISFAFAAQVTGLTENDITVTDGTGEVSTGALTMAPDGRSGSLDVTAVANPGSVQVSINRQGIAVGSQTVEIFNHEIAIPWAAVAVGIPTTTAIDFIFGDPVLGLTENDITVTDGTGEITTGVLDMAADGRSGSLAVTAVTTHGYVTVSVNSPGVASGSQTVIVFNHEITEPDIPWAAVAVGVPTTTSIDFTFGALVVSGLTENDITVVDSDGEITTGVLTMAADGRSGSLAVTAIANPGNVQVSINRQGIAAGSQLVMVFDYDITVPIPWAAVAVGVPYTTHISFAFADQVTGITTSDITVTDGTGEITTGVLTMVADGRSGSLAVTTITNPGSVQVSINSPGVASGLQTVEIFNYEIAIPWVAVAVGAPYTNAISFAFAAQVTGLTTNDITVTSGTGEVTTGALTMAPDGRSGSLAVTAITNPGNVQVSINRQGIAVEPQTVEVFNHEIAIPWAAVAVGIPTTTAIDFIFGAPVLGLATNNVMVVGGDGAVITGALTMAPDGRSGSLAVTTVTSPGYVTVSVNSPGVASGSQTVEVIRYVPLITWTVSAAGSPTTTAINFTFNAPISGLTQGDITILDGAGAVTTGGVSGSGTSWSLAVTSVTNPGNVFVLINSPGVASGPQMVDVVRSPYFTISFADFQGTTPYIIGPTVVGLFGPAGTITVLGQFHSIEWWQGGGSPVATGATLVLDSSIHRNQAGTHHITVVVRVNRSGQIVPYSRIVRFEVRLN